MALAVREVLAGAMLVNAVPHAVMGLSGKRFLTPLGGADSSPGRNLVWAAMNVGGAAALLASAGWRSIEQHDAEVRLASLQVGAFAMAAFGMAYELTAGRRAKRTPRQLRTPSRAADCW